MVHICTVSLVFSAFILSNTAYYQAFYDGAQQDNQFGSAVSVFNTTLAIGARHYGSVSQGAVFMYTQNVNNQEWELTQTLTLTDANDYDFFGSSLALNSDHQMIIGAYGVDAGAAYIYDKIDGEWTQTAILIQSDSPNDDECGYSVDIHDNYAIVGCYHDDETADASGAVHIFEQINNHWIESVKLKSESPAVYAWFGIHVAIFENTAVILETPITLNSSSAIYIFESENEDWILSQKLLGDIDASIGSIDIFDDQIVVGSDLFGTSRKVYLFTNNGTQWIETQTLQINNSDTAFGKRVSINENTLVTSAYNSEEKYVFYIFEDGQTGWTQQTILEPENTGGGYQSVSIWGDFILIGSGSDDTIANNAGSAHIYHIRGQESTLSTTSIHSDASTTSDNSDDETLSSANTPSMAPIAITVLISFIFGLF